MATPSSGPQHPPPVRVGLLGCGTVGAAFLALVDRESEAIAERSGLELSVTRIAVRDVDARAGLGDERFTSAAESVVADPAVDIVVELMGGIEPAQSLIRAALLAGKPVVSANKELLASHGAALHDLAAEVGLDLLYEASVGGAIPLVRALSVSLVGERVRRIMGIVNGTTNLILSRMTEARTTYADALAEAMAEGFAEADPTADVEGYDAAAKTAIMASIAFNADVRASDVFRQGITDLEPADIEFAERRGAVVKLLAIAERSGDAIVVRVHPAMLPAEHPLAAVHGPFNAVFVEGDHAGELMLYGRGAGGAPTASAVLGDVLDAAHRLRAATRGAEPVRRTVPVALMDELESAYCISLDVVDRPGVLAAVATVVGEHAVSIRSMEQVGLGAEARMIFITHRAQEAHVQATLAALKELPAVVKVGSLIRMVGDDGA